MHDSRTVLDVLKNIIGLPAPPHTAMRDGERCPHLVPEVRSGRAPVEQRREVSPRFCVADLELLGSLSAGPGPQPGFAVQPGQEPTGHGRHLVGKIGEGQSAPPKRLSRNAAFEWRQASKFRWRER